jgi:phage-related protein
LEKLQEAQDALTVAHERANEAARNYDVTLMMSALTVIPSLVSIINVASNAEEIWEGIQWALNAAMDANPIGIVIVAIAALVAAFILAYTHCKPFRDAINDLGTVLGGFFKEAVEVVAKALETEWTAAVTVVEAVLNGLKAAFNGLVAVWNTIHNAWDVFCGAISSIWNSTVGLVVKAVEDFANTIHTIFETLFGWIVGGSIWKDLCSGIATIWNDTAGALLKDVQAFANDVASIFKDMGKGIGGAFKDISSDVTSAISDIGNSVYKGFTDAEKSVSNAMQSVAKDVSGGLKDAGSAITNFINSICFAHALKSASDDSSNTMSNWTSMMESSMTKGIGHVRAFVAAIPGQFDTVKTVLNSGIASFNNLANGISGAVSSSEASMNAWLSNLQSDLAAGISAIQAFNASICFAHGLASAVAQSRDTMDSWNTMLSSSMQKGLDLIRGFNNEVGLSGLGAGIAGVGSYGGVPTGGAGSKPVTVTLNAPLVNIEGSADKKTVQLASQQVLSSLKSIVIEPTSSSAPATQKRIRNGAVFT